LKRSLPNVRQVDADDDDEVADDDNAARL